LLTAFVLALAAANCSSPAAPALVDGPTGLTITFGELEPMIKDCASGLAKQGLKQGGVLAILSTNLPE